MTWTVVTDAQLAVNKPARSTDIKAIRDNITALANGDAGAPEILHNALVAPTAGATYLLANIILDTGSYAVTTGDTSYSAYSHFHIGCPSVFANTISWCAIQTGTYRVVVKHTRQTATTYVRALKNNALVSEFAYTGAVLPAYATREWDIAVNKGDLITIQHKCASTATSHLLFMGIYSATDVIGGA